MTTDEQIYTGNNHVMGSSEVEYRQIEDTPWYRFGSDGTVWSRLVRSSRGRGNGGWCWRVSDEFHRLKTSKKGYTTLTLKSENDQKVISLHVVIATLFSGPKPFTDAVARHWDGDPTNNKASNIRWGTVADNSADMIRHGRSLRGSKANRSKLSEPDVEKIREMIRDGQDNTSIAVAFNVTGAAISMIRCGANWSHLGGWDGSEFKVRDSKPKILTWNGRTQRLCEWARELGISRLTLNNRLWNGWSVEKTLSTPVNKGKRNGNAKCA